MIRYRVRRIDGTITEPLTRARAITLVTEKLKTLDDGERLGVFAVEISPIPEPPATATDKVAKIWTATLTKFPELESWGVYNCRYISGTHTPSQHAWGNAVDWHSTADYMERVAKWTAQQGADGELPIAKVLYANRVWRPDSGWFAADIGHDDHIHVEGRPVFTGTPSCL